MPSSRPWYLGFLFARPAASQGAWPPTLPASAPGWAPRRMQDASMGRGLSTGSRETHWGAGMTADSHASPSTGRERGHHRHRTRPWLVGTYEPVRSRRGVCNTPGAVRWAGGNP